MSVSFEALAMAGVDFNECGMTVEEWERPEMMTPPYLLAEEEVEENGDYKDHISLKEVPVLFPVLFPSSSKVEESRGKCEGEKKLPVIMSKVKNVNLVKQLSSKKIMIESMLPARILTIEFVLEDI